MELAPADVPLSFEVTFSSNDLIVGMSVYDVTGVNPVLVQGPSAMPLVYGNTYQGKFTGLDGHNYIIVKGVYTDNTYAHLSEYYSQGSESIVVQVIGGGGGTAFQPTDVIGIVLSDGEVIGIVDNTAVIVGQVDC